MIPDDMPLNIIIVKQVIPWRHGVNTYTVHKPLCTQIKTKDSHESGIMQDSHEKLHLVHDCTYKYS